VAEANQSTIPAHDTRRLPPLACERYLSGPAIVPRRYRMPEKVSLDECRGHSAETVGFEPTEPNKGFSTLAGWCTRPNYATSPEKHPLLLVSNLSGTAGEVGCPPPLGLGWVHGWSSVLRTFMVSEWAF
jgi:hypothetical protein